MPSLLAPAAPVALVLDTNVVLDWLVFHDPSSTPLADAFAAGRARWLACARMRDELEHVLTRGSLATWRPDPASVREAWQRCGQLADDPPPRLHGLRCTDPDDQVFLDLALHHGAAALLSRDRALLRLARAARRHGLPVLTPEAWARSVAGETDE